VIAGSTFEYTTKDSLIVRCCATCGIYYAVSEQWQKEKVRTKGTFYCPNGCCREFRGENEEERLRKALEQEKEVARRLRESALDYKNRAEAINRQLIAAKGQQTKLKKRIANGVCPCCKRSFCNLSRHMKSQHPDFVEEQS
jgi:hypothetical protein